MMKGDSKNMFQQSQTVTNINQIFKYLKQWLVEAIWPTKCLACGREGSWCCPVCLASFTFPRQLNCPDCGTLSALGEFCAACKKDKYLNGLWPTQSYGNPNIRSLIKSFKFEGLTGAAPYLVELMYGLMRAFNLPPAWHTVPANQWCLTPVPLTNRRQRARNFNQSELLAKLLAEKTALPYENVLLRIHFSKPQSELSADNLRLENVKGCFEIKKESLITGRIFILVDDVYTTGATMEECAKVLKKAGACEVWGLVVAKG